MMHLEQFFAPDSWAAENASDQDMSTAPALLPDGQVVLAGKSRVVYLLNGTHLGGIGGQQAKLGPVCTDDIMGGMATVGDTVYLPCLSGIVAVTVTASPPGLRLRWRSSIGGSPPIVADGLVWTMSHDGTLSGIDPATGKLAQKASIGAPANHFPTPSAGDGLLLAASSDKVVAFQASTGGRATSPATRNSTTPASQPAASSPHNSGGPSPAAIGGIVAGVLIVAAGVGWLIYRRRASRIGGSGAGR